MLSSTLSPPLLCGNGFGRFVPVFLFLFLSTTFASVNITCTDGVYQYQGKWTDIENNEKFSARKDGPPVLGQPTWKYYYEGTVEECKAALEEVFELTEEIQWITKKWLKNHPYIETIQEFLDSDGEVFISRPYIKKKLANEYIYCYFAMRGKGSNWRPELEWRDAQKVKEELGL